MKAGGDEGRRDGARASARAAAGARRAVGHGMWAQQPGWWGWG